MIVELFVSLSLAQASPTQAQVLQRGERIGAWSVVLKLCKAADYTIDPAPAEAELVAFEESLSAHGLSPGDGARAFDVGMYQELEVFRPPERQGRAADSDADIARLVDLVKARCRDVSTALPGSVIDLPSAENAADGVIAKWYEATP
jgi:hypothetical protein